MRFVLPLFCALALALPASAQSSGHFADLSALDAAIFARSPEARPAPEDALAFTPYGRPVATFTPFTQTLASRSFLQNLQDVRRYGGRLSVPFYLFDRKFLFEGEGSRDFGPATRRLDIGRLRVMKEFGGGYSAGFEFGLFRGNPSDLRGAPHIDREQVFGFDVTKTFSTH